MDGLTTSYLDVLHSLIKQILSVIHNHFSLAMLGYYVNHSNFFAFLDMGKLLKNL